MNQNIPHPDSHGSQAETRPVRPAPYPPPQGPASQTRSSPLDPRYEPPPTDPLASYQPIRVTKRPNRRPASPRSCGFRGGCGCLFGVLAVLLVFLVAYFLFPTPTRLVLMGVDIREDASGNGSALGRTDTLIVMQVNPLQPEIKMLSIPRDLWVNIPGIGENRINTAHFFAEAAQEGSGPQAVLDTIEANFGVTTRYYARIRFSGFREIVDAMGGLDIILDEAAGGYEAGKHHLDGGQALAFARDRTSSGDDFGRMRQGQIVVIAAARRMLTPLAWPRIPAVMAAFLQSVDTNLPVWDWPRIALALARGGSGIDNRTLTREMTMPFTTSDGAQVLGPNWDLIRPMVAEMFGP